MSTSRSACVFICQHDTIHQKLLDAIAVELQTRGIDVIRGALEDHGDGAQWRHADVVIPTIRHQFTRNHLLQARNLRGIVYPTIGIESLDLKAANELGIIVGHGATPENFIAMAEATLMLGLAMQYRLFDASRCLLDSSPPSGLRAATTLYGKTAGLIGFGRIGSELARLLKPFGTRTIVHTRTPRATPDVAEFVELDALLSVADIVFVLATLTPETRGMMGHGQLGLMKASAYLINTARGGLIDEQALYQALVERRIAGAALDVFEVEPLPRESRLRSLDNVILTPHIIGHSQESTDSLLPAAVENAFRIINGFPPAFCANPQVADGWKARYAIQRGP